MSNEDSAANPARLALARVVAFWPERWGEVERFSEFWRTTYQLNLQARKRLSGAGAHFEKALVLRSLADRLAPMLDEDEAELQSCG